MAIEWPSYFMHIDVGPGRAFTAVPFLSEADGQTCRYNLRLLQAHEFVVNEPVAVSGVPGSAPPAEQRRYVFERLRAWVEAGPTEADLLALRVQARKLPLAKLQAAALCGYEPARTAFARCQPPGLADAETRDDAATHFLRRLSACDAELAAVALCAMLRDLYSRMPEGGKSDEIVVALAALAAWAASPGASGVQAATVAIGLLPQPQAGRYRPSIYPALERALEALAPPHPVEPLLASLRHALDWASSTDLPYRFGALASQLLPAAYAAVLATCLGYPARLPTQNPSGKDRYEIVTQTRDHGDIYELEQDTTYYIVDRRSGQAILQFVSSDFSTYDGTWQHQSSSGVSSVEITADGRHVRVSEGGQERLVPIPDSDETPAAIDPAPAAKKKGRRRRRKAQSEPPPSGPECPRCARRDTTGCTDTVCLEGSLEYYHLVHTEVRYHYHCSACNTDWAEEAYL